MKMISSFIIISSLSVTAGCMPSSPITRRQMDRYWHLSDNPAARARPAKIQIEGKLIPARWTVHQQHNEQVAADSIAAAMDRLRLGAETIEFSFSPAHAARLSAMLAQGRRTITDLKELTETTRSTNQEVWSHKLARILTGIERAIRISRDGADTPAAPETSSSRTTPGARPLMTMLAVYLNEHAAGDLLRDLSHQDVQRLRTVLVQITLRLGFDIAGRELPHALLQQTTALMHRTDDLTDLRTALHTMLLERLRNAGPTPQDRPFRKAWDALLTAGPVAMRAMEAFLAQWDKVHSFQLELLRHEGRPILVVRLNVLPHRQVRVSDILPYDPTMVFQGNNQVVLIPREPVTGQSVVLFDSDTDSTVLFRFEGILYGLIRLLAFPLEDWHLREIRLYARTSRSGQNLIRFAVLMQTSDDLQDPRRMILFQQSEKKTIDRRVFSTSTRTESRQRTFHYIKPYRRYTYRQTK